MLSAESLKQIDIELAKYPADQRRSAIMGALRIAQTEKGWLAPETIAFVADYIGISPAQAYEVATFYNMYDLEPVGKYKLTVCTNLPCTLRGGMATGEYLKQNSVSATAKPRLMANLLLSKANAWAHVATLRSCWSTTTACAAL